MSVLIFLSPDNVLYIILKFYMRSFCMGNKYEDQLYMYKAFHFQTHKKLTGLIC